MSGEGQLDTAFAAGGWCALQAVLNGQQISELATLLNERFRTHEQARGAPALCGGRPCTASDPKFAPTTSSLLVRELLSEERIATLLAVLARGEALTWIRSALGTSSVSLNLDRAWVRRQYSPGHYPAFHHPHGWHQDGALGFNFLAYGQTLHDDAVLPMVTLWIALDPCGLDAPGLELITRRLNFLLLPGQLNDPYLKTQFSSGEFWRPVLGAGDALLFSGDILHRTHVTPVMTRDRHSLEFRFFPSSQLPARLKGDCFIVVEELGH